MSKVLKIGDISAEQGSVEYGGLRIARQIDGTYINVPIAVINGSNDGPTLWLQAGVHPDEIEGSEAVRRIIVDVKPENLQGVVIAVPVVNTLALMAASSGTYIATSQRLTPIDFGDANRSYPGRKDGFFTQRLVHIVFREICSHANYVMDFHGGGWSLKVGPLVGYHAIGGKIEDVQREMAKFFGVRLIHVWTRRSTNLEPSYASTGSSTYELSSRNIPTIVAGSGGEGCSTLRMEEDVKVMRTGILNVMRHLRMLDGEPTQPKMKQRIVADPEMITTSVGGLLRLKVKPGDDVQKGDELARVMDIFGKDVLEIIKCPLEKAGIQGIRTHPIVNPGSGIAIIGRITGYL